MFGKQKEERTKALKMFVVYDSVGEIYERPFIHRTRGEALRGFTQAVNDPQTALYHNPEDFTLFEIGEWCQDTGVATMYEAKVNCGVAIEYRNSTEMATQGPPRPELITENQEISAQ